MLALHLIYWGDGFCLLQKKPQNKPINKSFLPDNSTFPHLSFSLFQDIYRTEFQPNLF